MTQKDFELIAAGFAAAEAQVFAEYGLSSDARSVQSGLWKAQRAVAEEIEKTHPRFNRGKFDAYCFPLYHTDLKARILDRLEQQQG